MMNKLDLDFINIKEVQKSELASLHLRYLPTPFSGSPGSKLLELYYRVLSEESSAFGIAAVLNGTTVGFACAVGNAHFLQERLVKRFPFLILYWAFRQILYKPKILVRLLKRLINPGSKETRSWQCSADLINWYTYRPVVVEEQHRKYRIADSLTKLLIEEAERRQVPGIIAIVEQSNTRSLRHFSRHNFFELCKVHSTTVLIKSLSNQLR
ncbi:MAG: hypothetical protein WD425_16710 [Nitrospirales bacterium]